MKNLILLLFSLGTVSLAYGQDTKSGLFTMSNTIGGFGGISLNAKHTNTILLHGEGGFRYRNFYIGGFGYGGDLESQYSESQKKDYKMSIGQGGFWLGATSNTSNHWALFSDVKLGFGSLMGRYQISDFVFEEHESFIFTASPQIGISYTNLSLVQIRAFVGYQLSSAVDLDGVLNVDMNSPYVGISVYLGYFQ